MGKYKVRMLPAAADDLEDVIAYLNTLSPQAAAAYYDAIVAQIGKLRELPERFPLARDEQLRIKGYRIMPVKSYLVFYVVREKTVLIKGIMYKKRNYTSVL